MPTARPAPASRPDRAAARRLGLALPGVLALSMLAACSPEPESEPESKSPPQASAPTAEQPPAATPAGEAAEVAPLAPELLGNATYQRLALEGGPVTLVDGRHADGALGQTVMLLREPVAAGRVGGRAVTAVLLAESGGGSGVWVSVAAVTEEQGRAVVLGQATLGDRPRVQRLRVDEDGMVVVDYVTAGANDPFCCPATPVRAMFALGEGGLEFQARTTASLDAGGYAEQVNAFVAPGMAYDTSSPPEGQGEPAHFAWSFGSEQDLAAARFYGANGWVGVYPVTPYRAIWAGQNDNWVADNLGALERLLAEAPAAPAAPLPVLPRLNAYNDFASRVAYLALPGGGKGVRFVGRFSQDAAPLRNDQLRYVFQGLTADGRYLVVASIPVKTAALPEDTEVAVVDPAAPERDILEHLAGWRTKFDALAPTDFSPSLEVLDAMLGSVEVAEQTEDAGVSGAKEETGATDQP